MCGIGGVIAFEGDTDGLDAAALLAALRHRGPDRSAALSPSDGAWLCAARLAISDPTPAGNQPMSTEDGALTVVHNGEIYNAAALRDELRARGHVFRSRADTEVLLRGHREWGEALPARLEGMFAYAIWDARARRLTLARDPMGIKPLWLARGGGRLVFASEVRALIAARAVGASLDAAAIADYLAFGAIGEPRAIVRGVEALEPGTLATFADGQERRARWFTLPEVELERSPAEAAQAVRASLERAVNGCLEADVPVALLLSGGIDSSALAVIAGARRPIRTFHVNLGGEMAGHAAEIARSLSFQHEEVRADDRAAGWMDQHLAAQDQPCADGANTWLIARAIRAAGLKAAVSGLGADELFLGYRLHRRYLSARALAGRFERLAAPIARAAGSLARAMPQPFPVDKLLGVAAAGGSPGATWAALRALFPAAQAARLLPDVARPTAPEVHAPSAAGEISRLELAGYVRNTLLRDADVMGMAHGVELRVPMLERAVVETVLTLPPSVKLRPGAQKPLLTDAVPELPRALVTAKKRGFDLPFGDWLAGPLRAPVEESLRGGSMRVGLARGERERVWRRFLLRRDRASAMRCWALHALITWAERHEASR